MAPCWSLSSWPWLYEATPSFLGSFWWSCYSRMIMNIRGRCSNEEGRKNQWACCWVSFFKWSFGIRYKRIKEVEAITVLLRSNPQLFPLPSIHQHQPNGLLSFMMAPHPFFHRKNATHIGRHSLSSRIRFRLPVSESSRSQSSCVYRSRHCRRTNLGQWLGRGKL